MSDELKVYTDGASRGNPGPASAAFIITDGEGTVLQERSEYLGKKTNNQAEYTAVINALEMAKEYTDGDLQVNSDSNLLVKQLQGEWRVKSSNIKPLYRKVKRLTRFFDKVSFVHRNREHKMIGRADFLCNRKLDESGS